MQLYKQKKKKKRSPIAVVPGPVLAVAPGPVLAYFTSPSPLAVGEEY